MTRFGYLIILAGMAFASLSFHTAIADFSGQWKLNQGRSELGAGIGLADSRIDIVQKERVLNLTRTRPGMQGEEVTTREILSEAKESEVTLGNSLKKRSGLKWMADGQRFVIHFSVFGDLGQGPFEWKGTETWTISDDGKVLTVSGVFHTPQGELVTKASYDKQ